MTALRAARALVAVLAVVGTGAASAAPAARAPARTAPARAAAAAPRLPDAGAVMERCMKAWYYAGNDVVARLRMEIVDREGGKRYRVMTMLRKNLGEKGEQRYLIYFHEPGDVRRMTCMVWKHPGRNDERWMFVPAANKIRRVAAPERSRFLGSDFTREEFAGRDAGADAHRLDRYESYEGHPCWVVESAPRALVEHARMTTWVDTTTFLPWKQEFRDRRGTLFRTYTTDKVEEIASPSGRKYLTVVERTLWGREKVNHTKLYFESVRYDVGLTDADFAESHLRVPLDSWYSGSKP